MYFKNNFYSDGIDKFVVITVATEDNSELRRFKNSCEINNIPYIILGLGDEWKSGSAENGVLLEPGGAQKIIYLRDELRQWPTLEDHIILFTDSYDVVFYEGCKEILKRFRESHTQILFSSEKTCWPDESISDDYPEVDTDYKYLNSGGFIGYANQILSIINEDIDITYDDQLFYTEKFFEFTEIDPDFIKIDYDRNIFQTLNLAVDDVEFRENKCFIKDSDDTICLVHANGPSWIKKYLSEKTFDILQYSITDQVSLDSVYKQQLITNKIIQWSIFVQHGIEDIDQIFDHIRIMDYPKKNIKLHLVFSNDTDPYKIERFRKKYSHEFLEFKFEFSDDLLKSRINEVNKSKSNCDFLILMDSNHIFRNNKSIQLLITKNLEFVCPMMFEERSEWVNFSIPVQVTRNNIYNYIVKNHFPVKYVYGVYVIRQDQIPKICEFFVESDINEDNWDNYFCDQAASNGLPLYICNMNFYGSIIK